MCLIVVAFGESARWPVLLIANRDEFHHRPSEPLQRWPGEDAVVAGRDLQAGGTWLAVLASGNFAAVTNARLSPRPAPAANSRGELVIRALREPGCLAAEARDPQTQLGADRYGPFGLLIGGSQFLNHQSNVFPSQGVLARGIHALSNGPMNAPWPKSTRLRKELASAIGSGAAEQDEYLFGRLRDQSLADDDDLPQTGVGYELERRLAPVFINDPHYGTRASTIVRVGADGEVIVRERSFDNLGRMLSDRRIVGCDGCWLD